MERKYYITQVVVCLFILSSAVSAQGEGSCVGRCGEGYFRGHTCHCDYNCMSFMECCRDFKAVCTTENSCRGRCHEGFIRGQACDCDPNCLNYGKCCPDFESMCAKPISRRSPAPPPPEERRGPPDPSRNKDTDKEPEADKVPQEPDEDTGTTPSTVITPQPVKEKKQMPKKPKKPKKLVEAEEEIEEPGRGSFSPSVPPPPDKNADILMTPQTPRVGDDAADPVGSQEDSTDNPSSSTTPKTTKKRSPSNTNKKKINKKQENEESPSSNNKKKPPSKPSPKDIKRKKGTDPKDEKQDPAKGPDPSAKKDTKKPVSKGPKKRIIKVLVEDDTEEPQKPVKKKPSKKPSPKDTKRKKKFNPKEERQETVESEFTSSSQSTSSHRRSKSTSTLLSGKNKNIKNKNRKKIPDEKPLMPPKRKKDKDFLQTPEPTPADEGSGDDGSGMEFLQTTPSATSLSDSSPKETLFSTIMDGTISSSVMPRTENIVITSDKNTETPKALSTVEPSLRTTPGMNIFTDVSTVSKEPFKQTETPAQPTEESTSKANATSVSLTSRQVNERSTDPSENVGSFSQQLQTATSNDAVTSFYRNTDKTELVYPLTDGERAGNQKENTGHSGITIEKSTINNWTPYTTQPMKTEEVDKNTPLFKEENKDGLLIYPTVSSQNMENFTLLPTEIKIQQGTASTEGNINNGLTTKFPESKNSSFSTETMVTDMPKAILTTLSSKQTISTNETPNLGQSVSHPETTKISNGISTTDSTVTDDISGFVLHREPNGDNASMVPREFADIERSTPVSPTSVSSSIVQNSDHSPSVHTEPLYTEYTLNITVTETTQSGQTSPTNETPKTAVKKSTQFPADSSALVTVESSPDHLVGSSFPTVDAPQSLSSAQVTSTSQSQSSTLSRGLHGELLSTVATESLDKSTGDILTPSYNDYVHSKVPTQSSYSSSILASTTEHSSIIYTSPNVKENESRPASTQTPQKDYSEVTVPDTDTRNTFGNSPTSTQSTEQSTLTKEGHNDESLPVLREELLSTVLNEDADKGYSLLLDTKSSEAPTDASTMIITDKLNTNDFLSPTVTVHVGHETLIKGATSEKDMLHTPEAQSLTDMLKTVPNERNTEGTFSPKTPDIAFVEPTQWQQTDRTHKAPQPEELTQSSTGDTIADHVVSVTDISSAAPDSSSSSNIVTSETNTLGANILSTLAPGQTTQAGMQNLSITGTAQLPINTSLSVTMDSGTRDLSSLKILDTTPNIHTTNQHTGDSKVDVLTEHSTNPNVETKETTTGGQEKSSTINKSPDERPMISVTEATQIPLEITESSAPFRISTSPAMTIKQFIVTTEEQKIDLSPAASISSDMSEKPRTYSKTDVQTEMINTLPSSTELVTRDKNDQITQGTKPSDVVTEGALTSNFRQTISVPETTETPAVVVKTHTSTKTISIVSTANLKSIDEESIDQSFPTNFPQKRFTTIAEDGIPGTSPIIVTGETNKDIDKINETVPNLETSHGFEKHFETVTGAERTLNTGTTLETPGRQSLNRSASASVTKDMSEGQLFVTTETGNSFTFGLTASQMPYLTAGVSAEPSKIRTTSTSETISSSASKETMLDSFSSITASVEQTRAVTEASHEGQTSPVSEFTTQSSASYTEPITLTSIYKEGDQERPSVTNETSSSSHTLSPATSVPGTLTDYSSNMNTDQKSPETSTIISKEHHIMTNSTVNYVPTLLEKTLSTEKSLTTVLVSSITTNETTRGNMLSSLFTDDKGGKTMSPTIETTKGYTEDSSSLKADLETTTVNTKDSSRVQTLTNLVTQYLNNQQSTESTGERDGSARDKSVFTTSSSLYLNESARQSTTQFAALTTSEPNKMDIAMSNVSTESYPPSSVQTDHSLNTPISTDPSSVSLPVTKSESPVTQLPESGPKHASVSGITSGSRVPLTNASATQSTALTRLSSQYTINTPESTTETFPKLSSSTKEVNTSLEENTSTNNLLTPSFGFSVNTLTTLQEQSTPDNKSNANSYTTNSEGLQTSTSSMLKSTISTSHTNEPSSSTIRNIYDTPNQTSNVEYSTHKPSEQKDASSGQSTVFFTTQTIDWVPSSNAGESKENSTSTEGTNRLSSPTVGQQTEDLTTLKPELTDANTSGNRTYADLKETATTTPTTQPMESVSTTTQVNVASQQATTTSSENQQEHTTKDVTTKQVITEQQTKIPSVSSFSNSTVKSDLEQRPTVPESDPSSISNVTPRDESMANGTTTSLPTKAINIEIMETTTKSTPNTIKDLRETTGSPTTVKAISVEQMENKYNPNPPLSLDQYGICEMLLDKENKLGISESDLQSIREICMEIHPNFTTSVSTPSSETKLPSQNPSEIPTKHTTAYTTTPRVAQPNKKPLPPKTIIQIVEEINRKMHLTPTRNLTLFPSHKTNKSAAWILLLKKIRSPLDPQMNLCNGQPADGMTTLQNGSMVVFRGHYFWTLNQGGAVRQARKISDVWGIPSPIDTVFTRCNCAGKTFFFKGPRYWRFTNDVMDKGYPKEIIKGFGGLKGKITSVLSVAGFKTRPESVYFFKGGGNVQKYTFRQEQSKRCTKKKQPNVQYPIYSHNIQTVKYRYPRDVVKQQRKIQRTIITIKQEPLGVLHQEISIRSTWRGIPNNIVSAISLPNSQKQDGFDYFVFSKEKYYNINMSSKVAIKPPPNSEQKISKDWYKCKE
ncbi:proteoglycan 4 isoform X2 [Xenopus tropicalis]|uniref:Proteoglycan 4 isoform X2 n=2 Tax=Xenopus tropicalis TaxID=8364 RepID=A0A8J1JIS7_XENTR|nr:proteoglycan 4 isoform X2 [Xenopus tropicalis]